MLIQLKASYFKDANYFSDNCPIGIAVRKQKKKKAIDIAAASLTINGKRYGFQVYFEENFSSDLRRAKRHGYKENVIIREIELNPLKNASSTAIFRW